MSSRTQNSLRNIFTGFAGKIVVFVFAFSTRTAFARLLGVEYSGVDGLYSNILNVLSLADLGIGNVFLYFLYQSLAEKDEKKTAEYVTSFRTLYLAIGVFVFSIGLLLIPFLPLIVNTTLPTQEVVGYYVLYLINSTASYFFAYKTIVLTADQKQYITNICSTIFQIIMYLGQLLFLLLSRNFVGYLIIQVICTVGLNIILTFIAEKQYPYLRNDKLPKKVQVKKKELWLNLKATFLYSISSVVLNNTDNILISIIVGTIYVGKYSYYFMLLQYVAAYIHIFGSGMLASIGNLNTEKNKDKSYRFFGTLSLAYAVIATLVSSIYINCIQQFIPIWVGEEYALSNGAVLAMVLMIFLNTISSPIWMYREAMGLFREVQYVLLTTALLNLVLSVIMGRYFGVAGILLATSAAKLLTNLWYEPVVLYRKFQQPVLRYFLMEISFFIVAVVCIGISCLVCRLLPVNMVGVIIRAIVSALISGGILWVCFHRTGMWRDLMGRLKTVIRRKKYDEE